MTINFTVSSETDALKAIAELKSYIDFLQHKAKVSFVEPKEELAIKTISTEMSLELLQKNLKFREGMLDADGKKGRKLITKLVKKYGTSLDKINPENYQEIDNKAKYL